MKRAVSALCLLIGLGLLGISVAISSISRGETEVAVYSGVPCLACWLFAVVGLLEGEVRLRTIFCLAVAGSLCLISGGFISSQPSTGHHGDVWSVDGELTTTRPGPRLILPFISAISRVARVPDETLIRTRVTAATNDGYQIQAIVAAKLQRDRDDAAVLAFARRFSDPEAALVTDLTAQLQKSFTAAVAHHDIGDLADRRLLLESVVAREMEGHLLETHDLTWSGSIEVSNFHGSFGSH